MTEQGDYSYVYIPYDISKYAYVLLIVILPWNNLVYNLTLCKVLLKKVMHTVLESIRNTYSYKVRK